MKKIVASLICILFLGGCSNKTAGMVALGVIHSPQIVALGAVTVVTSPFWILEKIEENSRKAKERIEKDSSLSVPFYKLVDLCNPKFNLEPKITDEFLEEIKHELSYFKEREKYFLQILNKLNDEKSEEYKKFTQEYEKIAKNTFLLIKRFLQVKMMLGLDTRLMKWIKKDCMLFINLMSIILLLKMLKH